MRKIYTNVGIPSELAKAIDKIIPLIKRGYRSRAEFVIEAIRQKIEVYHKSLKHSKKSRKIK
jgi:metal-responsive CopG/Arc/MetJ family transcriptional regulator